MGEGSEGRGAHPPIEELDPRLREVLLSVLHEYVDTVQPVASRSVAERIRVSSATVRSAMADLAERQLLSQPHTSSGRVPTERAFRLWVDHLMRETPWSQRQASRAQRQLSDSEGHTEDLLRRAADLLSEGTGQLGFFVAASPDRLVVQQVHFVRLSTERVMAVLISERGVVQTRFVREAAYDPRTLEKASSRLTEFVQGYTLREARVRLAGAIERERERSDALWRAAFRLGEAGLSVHSEGDLYLADMSYLLVQPEFSDVTRLREVLAALAEKERMMHLLDEILRADALQVVIGGELDLGTGSCAVVTAPFGADPALGGLGVIGPVRMRYDRVVPAVRAVSRLVGSHLS